MLVPASVGAGAALSMFASKSIGPRLLRSRCAGPTAADPLIRIRTESPQPRFSVSGKRNFVARDKAPKCQIAACPRRASSSILSNLSFRHTHTSSESAAGLTNRSAIARQHTYPTIASDLVPAFQLVSRVAEITAEAHVHPLLATPQIQEANTEAKF